MARARTTHLRPSPLGHSAGGDLCSPSHSSVSTLPEPRLRPNPSRPLLALPSWLLCLLSGVVRPSARRLYNGRSGTGMPPVGDHEYGCFTCRLPHDCCFTVEKASSRSVTCYYPAGDAGEYFCLCQDNQYSANDGFPLAAWETPPD